MSRKPEEVLRDALAHLQTMQAYAEHDLNDQLVIDAACMRLSAAIEVLATLEPDVRNQLFGADWPLMWGMRNRIAHGYLLVTGIFGTRRWCRSAASSPFVTSYRNPFHPRADPMATTGQVS